MPDCLLPPDAIERCAFTIGAALISVVVAGFGLLGLALLG